MPSQVNGKLKGYDEKCNARIQKNKTLHISFLNETKKKVKFNKIKPKIYREKCGKFDHFSIHFIIFL